ncbi:MAG: alpha/beta fold hydrolase [Rhizobacter sp.]
MSNAWFMRPAPRPNAKARLFCFPYAGGGAAAYRLWPTGLPAELEVVAIQLPGRANRLREPALNSISAIVDALVPVLLPQLDLPCVFFGHSMGSLLAAEVARALVAQGLRGPRHLVVSGRRPPHMKQTEPLLHALPDAEFVSAINQRYGGIPAEVAAHADLLALLLPSLRADIQALETHHPPIREPMGCPISVFGGGDDRLTPRTHLDAWRSETSAAFRVRVFPGDHFYLAPRMNEVLADLSATVAPLLDMPETTA